MLMLGLGACTIAEENAPEALADAWCHQQERCYRADFDQQWDNQAECVAEIEDFLEGVQDLYDLGDCEYDARAAAQVRGEINGASCEEFAEGDLELDAMYECG